MIKKTSFYPSNNNKMNNTVKDAPFDIEAEKGVIGAILLNPSSLDDIEFLKPQDFYSPSNELLYKTISELYAEGNGVDLTIIVSKLRLTGDIVNVGGESYIAEVMSSCQVAVHVTHYAKIVHENAIRRDLISKCASISQLASSSDIDIRKLSSMAEEAILSIDNDYGNDTVISAPNLMTLTRNVIEERKQNRNNGISTGFLAIDRLTGGFHESELIILAARPGMGKTSFALNIAERAAVEKNTPVIYFSLEMSKVELGCRLLSSRGGINGLRFRDGIMSKDDQEKLVHATSDYYFSKLSIDDSPSRTTAEIAANARKFKRQNGLGLVIIDYLGLVEPDDHRIPRQEQVSKIVRRFKCLAKELNIPVLCLCQLNRNVENSRDNRPKLSNLRESGSIEQDADVVMFVHRDEYYKNDNENRSKYVNSEPQNNAVIIIAKQRSGPIGDVPVLWESDFTRFKDLGDLNDEQSPAFAQYNEFADFGSNEF